MERISEENIENLMPVADGYAYYKDFAKAIAQTQLEACEKEHLEKMKANALSYGAILKASKLLHQKAMRALLGHILTIDENVMKSISEGDKVFRKLVLQMVYDEVEALKEE